MGLGRLHRQNVTLIDPRNSGSFSVGARRKLTGFPGASAALERSGKSGHLQETVENLLNGAPTAEKSMGMNLRRDTASGANEEDDRGPTRAADTPRQFADVRVWKLPDQRDVRNEMFGTLDHLARRGHDIDDVEDTLASE